VAHRLDGLRSEAESDVVVPIESLTYAAEDDVVPIESLAPAPETAAPTRTANVQDDRPSGLELTFRTLARLIKEQASTSPTFSALLGGAGEEAPVPIGTLCYRGHAALQRANTVRDQIAVELGRDASLQSIQPLLQELLDLVPLALAEP
jgi:hypothetical protein